MVCRKERKARKGRSRGLLYVDRAYADAETSFLRTGGCGSAKPDRLRAEDQPARDAWAGRFRAALGLTDSTLRGGPSQTDGRMPPSAKAEAAHERSEQRE